MWDWGLSPNSIVLSAQEEANFRYVRKAKTVEFLDTPRTFLILDGQHRVFGFMKAKSELRVPVVVYNDLSRADETKLFIDINTKQRPVPNELLLDIRKLAEYQDDVETRLSEVFDLFNESPSSPLGGLLSPSKKRSGLLSRVTFNAALKPLLELFQSAEAEEIYRITAAYFAAIKSAIGEHKVPLEITNPVVFRGLAALFPDVARIVKDGHGPKYSFENFNEALRPLFKNMKSNAARSPGNSVSAFYEVLSCALKAKFSLA
jgi:DGQHR domain-containing protein